jgi:hypothetical protein
MGQLDLTTRLFDDGHYAAGAWRKVKRAAQLGPRYYFWDLPRYWLHRRALRLAGWDAGALFNPLRELLPGSPKSFPLPPAYPHALQRLADAGVRLTLPRARLDALVGVWWTTQGAAGDVIECGSYRGATALALALLGSLHGIRQRTLLLDTFTGSPPACDRDFGRSAGEFVPPADQVALIRQLAAALGVLDRIEIQQGLFTDTFSRLREQVRRFAFVHIDANLYQGTREACTFTLPRCAPGGAIVFDDYNGLCDLGARLAIDQALAERGLRPLPLVWSSAYLRIPDGERS